MNQFFKISEGIISDTLDKSQLEHIKKTKTLTSHQQAILYRILVGKSFNVIKEIECSACFLDEGTVIDVVDVDEDSIEVETKRRMDNRFWIKIGDFFNSVDLNVIHKRAKLDKEQIEEIKNQIKRKIPTTKHQLAFLNRELDGKFFTLNKELQVWDKTTGIVGDLSRNTEIQIMSVSVNLFSPVIDIINKSNDTFDEYGCSLKDFLEAIDTDTLT